MNIVIRNPDTGNVYTKFSLPNLKPENVRIEHDIVNETNSDIFIDAHPIEPMSKLQEEFNRAQYL